MIEKKIFGINGHCGRFKKEIQAFVFKKTKIILSFINLSTGECYNEIKCEWLKTTIKIKENSNSS